VFLRMFWNFISSLPVKRGGSLSFLVGTISNVLVMEIGWTDVGTSGYILVGCAHSNTSFYLDLLWHFLFPSNRFDLAFMGSKIKVAKSDLSNKHTPVKKPANFRIHRHMINQGLQTFFQVILFHDQLVSKFHWFIKEIYLVPYFTM
jgi:hypothetical protein